LHLIVWSLLQYRTKRAGGSESILFSWLA